MGWCLREGRPNNGKITYLAPDLDTYTYLVSNRHCQIQINNIKCISPTRRKTEENIWNISLKGKKGIYRI